MAGRSSLLTWEHRHSPVILPDGPSGHERIRADPTSRTCEIASEDADDGGRLSPRDAPELYRSPTRMTSLDPVDAPNTLSQNDPIENAPVEPAVPSFGQLGLPQQLVTALE